MRTNDLIAAVAEKTGATKKTAEEIIKAFLGEASEALAKGEEVDLHGFGKFKVKERAARQGRNPATGEAITIAASKGVGFSASKALKDRLG